MFKKFSKMYKAAVCAILLIITGIAIADISPIKTGFWNTGQKGANIFNCDIVADDIREAKKYGITFIRLAPDKFTGSHRDFLIGDADDYKGLVKEDLKKLKQVLNIFQKEEMPVVLTMLSLPGSRWKQNNKDKDDLRVWKEEKYQAQTALFWKDLAAELKDHPAVIGYNILNEPHPERIFAPGSVHIHTVRQAETQAMLYDFYKLVIQNIRLSDVSTPIILDSSAYADPKTFTLLKPHEDENILYSFHMYEPYEYTNHKMNNGKIRYPGNIAGKLWKKSELKNYMSAVKAFQKSHKIPVNRILVGEFGGHRMSPGLDKYFRDLISIFHEEGWHFAFYAFREDTWDGMDYELGDKKLPWSYWKAIERGQKPHLERKDVYPAFSIIKDAYMNLPY